MPYYDAGTSAGERWPWSCCRCGTTIYHDAMLCRDCERSTWEEPTTTSHELNVSVVSLSVLDIVVKVLALSLAMLL